MKSRAECLTEYGSDYMIRQKVNAGELFKVGKASMTLPLIATLQRFVTSESNSTFLHQIFLTKE